MATTTESETASSTDLQLPPTITSDTRGKHRILAELKRLEQETRFLEEELEELETADRVSVVCPELLLNIESRPDALLPVSSTLQIYVALQVAVPYILAGFEPIVKVNTSIPKTNGPLNPYWDRWFEGPQESRGCSCWIL